MAAENTPLLATVKVGPPRRRYPHNIVRRFCTIALASLLTAFLIFFVVTLVVHPEPPANRRPHDDQWSWPGWKDRKLTYEQLKEILLETPSSEKAREWSRYYTAGPHLAGQNYSQVWI